MLAFDFVAAYSDNNLPFFVKDTTTVVQPLAESPQQITLRFTPGVKIDPASLGGISVVRSGAASDALGGDGGIEDIPVALGSITVDDAPNENQVVIRFAETLPDDNYRITIQGASDPEASDPDGLRTVPVDPSSSPEAFDAGLPDNTYSFDFRVDVGNVVVSVVPQPVIRDAETHRLVIDSSLPAVPTVTFLASKSDLPTIRGTATVRAGETLSVGVNGVVYTPGDGSLELEESDWSLTIPVGSELQDGAYEVTARVVENTNPSRFTTSTGELVVDTSLPEVHPLATSAARPTITGTATILAGQTLAVIVNGVEYLASAEGPLRVANGFWELQLPVDLADGVYQVFATVTDANDVVMPAVATALVIDSDLPAVPTVTSRLASTGTPAISGTAVLPLGQTLRVRVNGIDYLEGAPDSPLTLADGVWTLLIPEGDALDDGVYIVTAIVSDADDNSTSATGVLTVDITAPLPPPTVDALTTSNPKPVVTGTAAVGAGEILVVEVAGVEYRVADAALTHDTVLGTWSLDLTGLEQDLPNDTYQVTATVTDPSGNSSVAVANLVIDTTLPAVPTVNRLATNQTQPVITGTARVGGLQQLTVTVNGVDYPVGADLTLAGNDPSAYRTWTLTIPAADALPADGIYQVTATVAERFQPARFTSASADLVLDRVAPARPWVDRVATSAATPVVTGRVTLQAEEVLTVMLASAALAEPRSYSTAAGEITFAGDVWSLAIPADQPLPDGAYTVTATVTDAAGNATSNADGTLSQARDTVIVYFDPHEPLERQAAENPSFYRLLEVNPQTGADVGLVMVPAFVAYDRAGAKATLTFSVDLPDGKLFRLEVGDPTYVAPVATGSVQILAPAAPVVNTVGVLVDGVSLINDATPTISGTGAAGSHLVFLVDADLDGAPERVVGDLVVPAGGVWNFTVADALQEGRIAFVAMLTDPATGQVSPATTGLIEIDLTPPGAPVIDPAVPQNTSLPTITGTGEPGATVAVYADVNGDTVAETLLGSATVGADSTWTIVATTGVPAGTRVISVVQTDPAGNTSVAAAGIVITTAALVNNVPAGAGGVSTGTGDDFRIAQMEWNGQTVDVVADSWVIRATSAAEALSQIPFGWSVRSLGLDFYGVETPGATTAEVTTWAAAASGLAYIEPNAVIQGVARTPNDPRYSDGTLWGLHNTGQSGGTPDADIDAPEAWDVTTGSSNVVIAVIDTGIDYTHPDLAGNIWVNPGEIAGNGVDDDGNGFVDDIHGWDFAYGDSDPMDVHGHGTHCAGTIGAENGNTGIVGVTWDVQIMAIKALDDDGYYGVADTIAAVNYVTMMRRDHGINVVAINASYGGYYYSQAEVDAITVAGDVGVIFVAAAANDTNDNDSYPAAPASYPNDNIIAVAATDRGDQLASFSNYGQTSVDLAAPGVAIYSTLPGNTYASWQGTSMAAPHVTGVVALLAAEYPNATAAELRGAILAGATANPNPNLAGLVATGGQLNAFASLQSLATPVSRPTVDSRLTNDATPRITGTATVSVGDSLKVAVNGREYLLGGGQLVLNGTAWELDIPPAHALVEGTYPVVATVSNAFESVQGIGTVTIDLTPPAAPTVNPLTTSDTTPTITGTATRAAGDVLTVEVNEVVYQVGTNLTVSGNNWSLTVPVALEDGTYPVRAVVTDAAGNTADDQEDLVVNTAFPVVPTVTSLITNDDPPTITGTATVAVGETLTVSVAGQDYAVGGGDLTHDGTDWTLVVPNPLNEGEYEVTARVAGVADPTRSSVATGTVTVDLTPPAAPTVNPLTTSDTTPTITGTATRAAGDVLTVEVNEVVYQVGTNLTVSGNNWSLTVPVALEDGTYPVRAVVTDAAGNTADDQEDLVVNTAFPVVPTVTSLITNDDPPTITGTATVAVGETLTVSVAGQDYAVGGGDLTHDGTDWTLVVPNALTDGTHNVTATVTDDFDATRFSNAAGFVIVDTTPPAVPTVNGSVSRDNTPSITGTATVADGEELIVLLSGITYRVGEGNLFLSGSDWILFVPQPLADGVHPVTATVTDLAGNASAASANITIDTEAPSIPTVDRLATNNANVVLTGSAVLAAGDVLTVWAVGNRYDNVAVDANDQWQINLGNVPDGTYDILAVVTDPAGNTAADVTVVELFVDTTPPDPPVFGALPPTSDRTPTIRGTGEPGTTLELRADLSGDAAYETVLGTVTVGTDSRWLIVPNQPLPEAANIRLSATLTDAVGNVSDPPTLATITTDTQAPAAPVITAPAPSNDTTPLIAGTAEPGARVIVLADTDGDGVAETFVGEALADNGGNWNVEVTALPENPAVALTVFQADAAGNISPRVTSAIEIDTTDPLAPVVGSLGANGEIPATSDRRPVIFGTGDPGTVVVVLADHDADGNGADTEIGRTQVRADGTWSVQANQDLPFGAGGLVAATIALSAQSIDAAGNASPLAAGSITIDPALASITALPTQGIAQPTISGRGRASDAIRGTAIVLADETLTVAVNGVTYTAGDGHLTLVGNDWALVIPAANALPDGEYIVTTTVAKTANAARFMAVTSRLVVDTTNPSVPTVRALATSDTTPTITGTAVLAAGEVLAVSVGGNQYAAGDGNLSVAGTEWSLTIPLADALGDGDYTVTATVTDAVGNASSNADINNLTIDTTLPVVPTVNEVISNTGEAVITGTATVDIGETLTVEVNGVVYAVGDDLTLDGNNWTLVVPADNSLDDDPYIVTATVSEDADATRFTTNANVLVIDTEAPQVPVVDPLVTSDTTPTITGTAVLAEGEVLAVSVGGNQYAVGDGNLSVAGTEWSLTIPNADALVDGDYTVTATVTDAAGNPSSNVDVNNLTIDTTLPAVPTATDLTSALRLRTITLLADLDRDGIPEAEVGSATIDGNGNWSLTPDQPLPAGEVAILAIQTDHLGVETSRFTSTVAIDTVAPLPPAINPLRATSVRRPTLSGTGEPGATVTIDVPADKDGDGEENEIRRLNTVVGTDGRWSREPTADLPEGDVVVRAWQTDTAGNESQVRQITIVIDPAATTAPQINPVAATFDRRPTITGVGQIPAAGTTVAITITADFDGDGYPETVIGSTNVANDGTWALVPDRDLPVGNVALAATQEIVVAEAAGPLGNNTTFAGAQFLGTLGTEGIIVDGAISVRPTITTPFGSLEFPGQPGTVDEPGHRDVPVDSGGHGLATLTTAPAEAIEQRFYNFKPVIGTNLATDEDYFNVITETQKQRAREIFELYSRYTGIRFTESADQGLTVATGDLRALGPETPPGPVAGLGGATMALMSSAINWGESEYGGGWFDVAMHEIGHSIGLPHSYDIRAIMGSGLPGEPIFPGDYDIVHLAQLYPANGADIDVYQFDVAQAGRLSAETVIARPGQPVRSLLDSVLTLYRQDATGRREMVARNDDSYGRDSFIGLDVAPGTYFVAVTSTGNDAFDPNVPDSGYGGRTDGDYQLRLGFVPEEPAVERLIDESGTPLDGDRDGVAGGTFQFWFKTAGTADTLFVDKAAAEVDADGNPIAADGSIEAPYRSIDDAIAAAAASTQIIRIVGNEAGPDGGPLPYLIGTDLVGRPLEDGGSLVVPAGVTLMIDEGAVLKFRAAIIDVGSSSELAPRQAAAIQVLGAPQANVVFTSWHDDSIGGDTDGVGPAAQGGQWGGIVLRQDSDSATGRAFLNSISQATFRYGGGQVAVDSDLQWFAPIQVESTRPQIGFNTIEHSAGPGIAATPNSFADTGDRIGPAIRGNVLRGNSINGLFVGIDTPIASPLDRLTVPTRWTNTDIVYVLQENLVLDGGVGGYEWRVDPADGVAKRFARDSGRLTIDPGVIVKIDGSRIELERGISQLIAEGTPGKRVIFTSLGDNRYGAGSTFDTNGNLPDRFDEFGQPIDAAGVMIASPLSADGDWGGIVLNAGSRASIDYAYLAFGGGQTRIEGRYELFNVIETHQGDLRLANSRLEFNQDGFETSNSREGRGWNTQATIFARGAQPVILWNDFRDNVGAVMSINANALSDMQMADVGRSTGEFFVTPQTNDTYSRFEDNFGPLVRGNRISYSASADLPATTGMVVRGEEITVESVWDDTDIVHVLRDEIIVQNFHTATGVRLLSRSDSSLVVKLLGTNAGFTAAGYGLDIDDRIGGTVQVVGQPGYPVILTSLHDDTVGASLDILGRFVTDTGNNGAATTAAAGDWRSLKFMPYSNDRNVSILVEAERAHLGVYRDGAGINDTIASAQALGVLGPNVATGGNTWESAQEKGGDETRRLGFEVHGFIAWDDATDVDVYSFRGYAGSEVWIDIDKTSHSLDTMVELLDAGGIVRARSADGQTWQTGSLTGIGVDQQKDAWRGGDFYTVNPKDAGMRLVLPGTVGNLNQYFIRVRSQATYTGATAANAYTNDLLDPTSGVSSGRYELRVRLRQRDEKPGSTVRYADIRYPVVGIDAQGLPRNSHLVGESGESSAGNDSFGSAQYLGNLLQSDRNTISVAGTISTATDVDWYTFALNYEQIQWIGGVNDSANAWSTIFDIDYADGIRGNLMISVFDESGSLIYVGHDSNVGADQPAAGQGADIDDLSRGSLGTLDPFIGPVQLPTDGPTGIIERGDGTTSVSPSAQQRYYVAISSNEHIPTALNAMFEAGSTNTLVRLEPVTSVRRVVEDHIGYSGFRFEPENGPLQTVLPVSAPIIDTSTSTALASNVRPFTLADVTLFVSSGEYLHTVDAFTGGLETTVTLGGIGDTLTFGDLDMRPDGRLYAYAGVANDAENVGRLLEIDTGTGTFIASSDDGIANKDADTPLNWETSSNDVLATAFRRTAIGEYDELWFVVRSGSASKLYRAATGGTAAAGGADATASQEFDDEDGLGYRGNIQIAGANVQVTGIQFSQDSLGGMYGVTSNGRFISIGAGVKPAADDDPEISFNATQLADFSGVVGGFTGLAAAPQNLENGRFRGKFFATTTTGRLVAIDPVTNTLMQNVFDTNNDGIGDSQISNSLGVVGTTTGLAFSPLDINLWHPTSYRGFEDGHGINPANDRSRTLAYLTPEAIFQDAPFSFGGQRTFFASEQDGGASMHFGLEQWFENPRNEDRYFDTAYFNNGQFGSVTAGSYRWQQELTLNPSIGDNYNLPGGAYGSLITNSFSLAGSTYADKPTLYFNYWLETQDRNDPGNMLDSARVFASADGGLTWELLATNNSVRSFPDSSDEELPNFTSLSSGTMTTVTVNNQHVQELFDTASWRQARIDLGEWAGAADLRLRFDFSTAGVFDGFQRGRRPDGSYGPINDIDGLANTTGQFNLPSRGQDNDFGGFFIDDIIVGFAERGELVTGTGADNQSHFTIGTPAVIPVQNLVGEYQLEIRRGTEFMEPSLFTQYDTNIDHVASAGLLGDQNLPREQGQFIVENNFVLYARDYGISIDAGIRGAVSGIPVPGVVRNFPTLNNSRLVPGAVVSNNVVSQSGIAGIRFSGDPSSGSVPVAAVPFGRIVNNTINGSDSVSPSGVGVVVSENAAPTLLNNLLSNLTTAISVDGSSAAGQQTVVSATAYWNAATQVSGGVVQRDAIVLAQDPYRAAGDRNFYLVPNSSAIDSGIDSLEDRLSFRAVNDPLGIAPAPILAPNRDLYGQLRGDDPTQASWPGLGRNVFKDRGAVERIDLSQPTAALIVPLDGSLTGRIDRNDEVHVVRLQVDQARGVTRLVLKLSDIGVGIDKARVVSDAFTVQYSPLAEPADWSAVPEWQDGSDYLFTFLAMSNEVVFESSAVFSLGEYLITVDRDAIRDLADQQLLNNDVAGVGTTAFRIALVDQPGLVTDVSPSLPIGSNTVELKFTAPANEGGSAIVDYVVEVQDPNDPAVWIPLFDGESTDTSVAIPGLVDGIQYTFRIAARNAFLQGEWVEVGPVMPMSQPVISLLNDTNVNDDGITTDGRVLVQDIEATATWQYSTDSGATWRSGVGNQFLLPAGEYAAGAVQVRQSFNGFFSVAGVNAIAFVIDNQLPEAVIDSIEDDVDRITGAVSDGGLTNDPTPTLTITTDEAASAVVVFLDGNNVGPATVVAGTGNTQWTFASGALASGDYIFTVQATDLAGNVGAISVDFAIEIDVDHPAEVGVDLPIPNEEGFARSNTVTVNGIEPTATWQYSVNGGVTWSDEIAADSNTFELADGPYAIGQIQVRQIDAAGNVGQAWENNAAISIDVNPPSAPALTLGPNVANGATRDEAKQAAGVVTVQGEVGAAITVTFNGDVQVTKPVIPGDGTAQAVSLTDGEIDQLGDGEITVTATQTDEAGNEQMVGDASLTFILDTEAPSAPGLVPGPNVANGATRDEAKQAEGVVTVQGEVGAAITVTFNGDVQVTKPVILGDGTAQAVSLDNAEIDQLGDGEITVTATQTDEAGNEQTVAAASLTFILDTVAPSAPELVLGPNVANGATRGDAKQAGGVVTVRGEAGAEITVTFSRGAVQLTKPVISGDGTSQAVSLDDAEIDRLGDGEITVTATQVDAAGNPQTSDAAEIVFTLDTRKPGAVIQSVSDDQAPEVGLIANFGATNDTTPTLTITTDEPASEVRVFRGDIQVGIATAGSSSREWSFTSDALTDGTYEFSAEATDLAGNVSDRSSIRTIVIDTATPTVTITAITDDALPVTGPIGTDPTNDTSPTLSGTTSEPASLVEILRDGQKVGEATLANQGRTWTFTSGLLSSGTYSFTARATDLAGNVATAAPRSITVDTAAPTTVISDATDNVSPVTGPIVVGGVTNDRTPALTITTTEAASGVEVFRNGVRVGNATPDQNRTTWTFTSAELTDGVYDFTAVARDVAGNASVASAVRRVTIDGTQPTVMIVSVSDDVAPLKGSIVDGGRTNDPRPTIYGTISEAINLVSGQGGKVEVLINGEVEGEATINESGTGWNFTPDADLPLGINGEVEYVITARAVDRAGNAGPVSAPLSFVLDGTVSAPTLSGPAANGGMWNQLEFPLTVQAAEPMSQVEVFSSGRLVHRATFVSGSEQSAYTFTARPLTFGDSYSFTARILDRAGNEATSAAYRITIGNLSDPPPPPAPPPAGSAPVIETVIDNHPDETRIVNVARNGTTDDSTPTLRGTAVPNQQVTVTASTGSQVVWTGLTQANADGGWSITATRLANGAYTFTAEGGGLQSVGYSVIIDAAAPITATAVWGPTAPSDTITIDFSEAVSGMTLDVITFTYRGRKVALNGGLVEPVSNRRYVITLPERFLTTAGDYAIILLYDQIRSITDPDRSMDEDDATIPVSPPVADPGMAN